MSSDIKGKVGWLKDENGEIFIPKTLTSAIQNAEGTNLDNLLKNLSPSPGGGGGNSQNGSVNTIISTLYTNEAGTVEDTINLTDDISNYDLLLLEGFHKNPYNDGRNYHNSSIYNANELCASSSAIAICNDTHYVWYQLSDNRTLTLKNKSIDAYMLSNIYGIKFSSNGGSSTATDITYDNATSGMTSTNVQDAIDEVFQSVSDGKLLIAEAITDKGISTSATDTFSTMASNIRNISGGGGSTSELLYTLTEGGVWKDVDYVFDNNDFGIVKTYSTGSDEPLVYNFCVRNIAIYGNYTTLGPSSENLNVNLSRVAVNDEKSYLKISLSYPFQTTEKIEMYKINNLKNYTWQEMKDRFTWSQVGNYTWKFFKGVN